jgi:3-dehydroquinate synthase
MSKKLEVFYEEKPCYPIVLEPSFDAFAETLKTISGITWDKVCIVTDSNVEPLYENEVHSLCETMFSKVTTFVFAAGEASKNLDTVQQLYQHLVENHFDRKSLLIALGGGVVGDLTGFTAATYMRGIDFIQIPTTLLSQVDSSIGGKTGVDFLQYKNMVGAFYMPRLVYINIRTLQSLPEVQFQSGMGEVIKHGLIKNAAYYRWLGENQSCITARQTDALEEMVYESCKIKRAVVQEDPKEQGIRGHLNFGHTFGHAVEKLSDFTLCHGQCVSIGMHGALYLSMRMGNISAEEYADALDLLVSYGLPITVSRQTAEKILAATKSDKKMVANRIKFIILNQIGEAAIYPNFSDEQLLDAITQIITCKEP